MVRIDRHYEDEPIFEINISKKEDISVSSDNPHCIEVGDQKFADFLQFHLNMWGYPVLITRRNKPWELTLSPKFIVRAVPAKEIDRVLLVLCIRKSSFLITEE